MEFEGIIRNEFPIKICRLKSFVVAFVSCVDLGSI